MNDFDTLIFKQKVNIQYMASSVYDNQRVMKYLFDNDPLTNFCSQEYENSYFQIDFIGSLVKIKSYIVDVGEWTTNFPKSWNLTAYNGKSWLLLSNIQESELNYKRALKEYNIEYNNNDYYNSIRITSTGENYAHSHSFCFADFDITGKIYSTNYLKEKNSNNSFSFFNKLRILCSILFLTSK